MNELGTLSWGRQRGGRLTLPERIGFLTSAVGARLRAGALKRSRPRTGQGHRRLDLEALRLPDTKLVGRALEICEQAYAPWLLNHCLRTWLWAGLVAQAEGLAVDGEALVVASLLHDLGLTSAADRPGCDCFAIRGALLAEQILADLGHPELAVSAAESIALHLNVRVPRTSSPLSYLLHQGASIDVIGLGAGKVGPQRDAVLARHPRLGLKNRLATAIAADVRDHPGSRMALMARLGFVDLVRRAPWAE